ncbi:hypothetical protein [Natronorubrum daqingense]|uniref:Uncharacterized protein n=1 Tax=Natronorubrum daqingense TaxID=588898 RepID=A0A1N6XCQ2_9EURY|nr:hypothetical protein [Natronorubrum daqingense]APX95986.1 hypothetical protein BB347_04770 [Natronorubrum daqingense]SIR00134.1 hypothetical protein SAMN05421809_0078 [Natronorubrum daqingense]
MNFIRRSLLRTGVGTVAATLAGCLDAISEESEGENKEESHREERREHWKEQDDFPDDDYRNREVPVFLPGGDSTTPDFGFLNGKDEDITGSEYTYELTIEALEEPVDVWIGPQQEGMGDDLDNPESFFEDESDFDYYDEYSQQSVELYEEQITVPDDDDYWYYVFVAGEEPSMAITNRSFVDIEVKIEGYHYVDFDDWYEDIHGS